MEIGKAIWATPYKLFDVHLVEQPEIGLNLSQYWVANKEDFVNGIPNSVNSRIMIGLTRVEILFLYNSLIEYFKSINVAEVYGDLYLVKMDGIKDSSEEKEEDVPII